MLSVYSTFSSFSIYLITPTTHATDRHNIYALCQVEDYYANLSLLDKLHHVLGQGWIKGPLCIGADVGLAETLLYQLLMSSKAHTVWYCAGAELFSHLTEKRLTKKGEYCIRGLTVGSGINLKQFFIRFV